MLKLGSTLEDLVQALDRRPTPRTELATLHDGSLTFGADMIDDPVVASPARAWSLRSCATSH